MGRITVVKSLLLSRLVHIVTSLLNPKPEGINKIQDMLWDFIWNGKRDKIKRALITQRYTSDGLAMVDMGKFVSGLKASWLKRLLKSKATWTRLAKYSIGEDTDISMGEIWSKKADPAKKNYPKSNLV